MLEPGGPLHKPLQKTGGGPHPGERDFTEYAGSLAKRQPGGRALLVAIDGYGGSGKSTFAAFLQGALQRAGASPVTIVEADGFVLNLREEDWRPIPSRPGMCAPYRIDLHRLRREVLAPLRGALPAQFVHRDWWCADKAEVRTVPSRGIVLVEGVYTLDSRLREFYDERIFLECSQELALERALARDVPPGGDEVGELVWREIHGPAESAYVSEQDPRAAAHVIVDSSQPIGPDRFVTLDEGSL
jgi:phosphoribulokinase